MENEPSKPPKRTTSSKILSGVLYGVSLTSGLMSIGASYEAKQLIDQGPVAYVVGVHPDLMDQVISFANTRRYKRIDGLEDVAFISLGLSMSTALVRRLMANLY
jgi:hypothetical protein